MALAQRIETLQKKHAEIDCMIHQEETRPLPNVIRLHEFKKEKLGIKDEIERLRWRRTAH
jgi:hypothetical protein